MEEMTDLFAENGINMSVEQISEMFSVVKEINDKEWLQKNSGSSYFIPIINKHKTTIGDGVFIGSGVELVAPVNIGAGATIGAGSTITKTAPDGELTVGRSKQVTIKGWKKPTKEK